MQIECAKCGSMIDEKYIFITVYGEKVCDKCYYKAGKCKICGANRLDCCC